MSEQGWAQTLVESSADDAEIQLLRHVSRGDRSALRELYAAYRQRLLGFMTRITGKRELAQEGVNDVMLIVWQMSDSFAGRSKVSTWILGIAYRRALELLERSRRWSERFKRAAYNEWLEHDAGASSSEAMELTDLLDRALRELSPEQRAVVELTYFGGYSYQEIATITDCADTVKTRMFHARRRLRAWLPALGKLGP